MDVIPFMYDDEKSELMNEARGNNFFKLPVTGIEPLTLQLQVQHSPTKPRGTPFLHSYWNVIAFMYADE